MVLLPMAFHWQRAGGLVIITADRTSQTVVQPSSAENFMAKMFSERELLRSQVVGQEARDQVSSWAGSLSCIHARSHSYISCWPVVWGKLTDAINKQFKNSQVNSIWQTWKCQWHRSFSQKQHVHSLFFDVWCTKEKLSEKYRDIQILF